MSANLGFVAHSAKRHANELASKRAGDRAAERSLANARRSDKTKDLSIETADQRQHGDEVEDAILHFLETVVILVEDSSRVRDIEHLVRALVPRNRNDPVDEVARRP